MTRPEPDQAVRCLACGHRCLVKPSRDGVCRVRFNRDGELRVPFGYVAGLAVDPIEKKPFYHAFPGRDALSFGMLGCDLHCSFCQNWFTSQTLRDPAAVSPPQRCRPEQLVALAEQYGAPVIASTYNEPLISSEWAADIFKVAKKAGMSVRDTRQRTPRSRRSSRSESVSRSPHRPTPSPIGHPTQCHLGSADGDMVGG